MNPPFSSDTTSGHGAYGALQAAWRPSSSVAPPLPRLLVAGAGGVLGNEVLRRLAGSGRFARTELLASEPIRTGLSSVGMVAVEGDDIAAWPLRPQPAQVGLIMFEPPRLYYERERALWTPRPDQLLPLATWMHRCGVQTLVVVTPHAPGRLPEALKRGLASLDERAVSGLGFAQVLLVRSARHAGVSTASGFFEKTAAWMLGIVKYMIPANEQPVRPQRLAEFIDEALQRLPAGTHVAPPELLWRAAQGGQKGMPALVQAWLDGRRPG